MALDENSAKNVVKDKIIYYRKELGLTQAEVADMLNISRSTYAYYEGKAPRIPAEVLNELAKILKVKPEDFLFSSQHSGSGIKFENSSSEYKESKVSVDENMILMIYRKLSDEDKTKYWRMLVDRYIELRDSGEISEDLV